MSFKDKIEKHIRERRQVLEEDDAEERKRYAIYKKRFEEVRPLLTELEESVDTEFVRIVIEDEEPRIFAKIYCLDWGNAAAESVSGCLWEISPANDANDKPFWYLSAPEYGGRPNDPYYFNTAAELFEHLLPKLAYEIAELQHEKAKRIG